MFFSYSDMLGGQCDSMMVAGWERQEPWELRKEGTQGHTDLHKGTVPDVIIYVRSDKNIISSVGLLYYA